jgi:hypothetical protein
MMHVDPAVLCMLHLASVLGANYRLGTHDLLIDPVLNVQFCAAAAAAAAAVLGVEPVVCHAQRCCWHQAHPWLTAGGREQQAKGHVRVHPQQNQVLIVLSEHEGVCVDRELLCVVMEGGQSFAFTLISENQGSCGFNLLAVWRPQQQLWLLMPSLERHLSVLHMCQMTRNQGAAGSRGRLLATGRVLLRYDAACIFLHDQYMLPLMTRFIQ